MPICDWCPGCGGSSGDDGSKEDCEDESRNSWWSCCLKKLQCHFDHHHQSKKKEHDHCKVKICKKIMFVADLTPRAVVPTPSCAAKKARGKAYVWLELLENVGGDSSCSSSCSEPGRLSWWVSWDCLSSDIPSFPGITLNQGFPGRNGSILLSLSNLWFIQSAVPIGFGKEDGNPFGRRVHRRLFLPQSGEITGSVVIPPIWVRAIFEGETYIQLSTEQNPDGEVRAQLLSSLEKCHSKQW